MQLFLCLVFSWLDLGFIKLVLWAQPVSDASAVVETRTVVPSDPIPERAIP